MRGQLARELEEARARVAQLERQALQATCQDLGCDLQHIGGASCGCHKDACCSIPVYRCRRCKGYDYGDNAEADEIRRTCLLKHETYDEEDNERID